jgi:hypothetical protein
MADDRDDFTEWRDNVESRVSTLEATVGTEARVRAQMKALREVQSDHTATLQDHTERLERLEAGQARLEVGQATVLVGVQTIIGLLGREIDMDSEPGGGGPAISG